MTREKALNSYSLPDTYSEPVLFQIINEIYDDFESRTCKNCKLDYCGCSIQDSIFESYSNKGIELPNLDDFGCKKFERK